MIEIEVCKRLMDWKLAPKLNPAGGFIIEHGHVVMEKQPTYHACIKGEPGLWDCGATFDEAIGNLIRTHAERFGIKVSDVGRQSR